MEIRVHGPGQEPEPLAVTMRTPGQRLRARGRLLPHRRAARTAPTTSTTVAYCLAGEGEQEYNVVTVTLRRAGRPRAATSARFVANASCGLCGKTTLDEVEQHVRAGRPTGPVVARSVLAALPDRLRAAQTRVRRDRRAARRRRCSRPTASCVALREDVGRHNALDKLIGHAVLERRAAARRRRC